MKSDSIVVFEDIQNHIIKHLKLAKYSVDIAVAWFTDWDIMQVLLDLLEKDVRVRILFYDDHINNSCKTYFQRLYDKGAEIRSTKDLMHNKFCIIDKEIVINGSYNWTSNAKWNNHENIQITFNVELSRLFSNEFDRLFEIYKKSGDKFKTSEELLEDYLRNLKYPARYPCFFKDCYSNTYVFMRDEDSLRQYYINESKENYAIRFKKGDNKNKIRYSEVFGILDKNEEFVYFPYLDITVVEKKSRYIKYIYRIDKNEKCVDDKLEIKVSLGDGYYSVVRDGKYYICDRTLKLKCVGEYIHDIEHKYGLSVAFENGHKYLYKGFNCVKIPDYFNPIKVEKVGDFFLISGGGYEALINLNGDLLIYPHDKININVESDTIECIEYPLWKKEVLNYSDSVTWEVLLKVDKAVDSKFNMEKYLISGDKIKLIDRTCCGNEYVFLSEKDGLWGEIYSKVYDKYKNGRNLSFLVFCRLKDIFKYKIKREHNDKTIVDDFMQKIEHENELFRKELDKRVPYYETYTYKKEKEKKNKEKAAISCLVAAIAVIVVMVLVINFIGSLAYEYPGIALFIIIGIVIYAIKKS